MYFLDKSQHLLLVIRYWLKTYFFQKLSTRYHSKPARSSSKTYPCKLLVSVCKTTLYLLQTYSLLFVTYLFLLVNQLLGWITWFQVEGLWAYVPSSELKIFVRKFFSYVVCILYTASLLAELAYKNLLLRHFQLFL